MKSKLKLAIIGAAGTVGSCTASAIVTQGLGSELILFDPNDALVRSHQMDLQSAADYLADLRVSVGQTYEELTGSDIVIVAASAPRPPVSSRREMLRFNFPIVSSIALRIREYCSDAIVINVVNPVDPLNWLLYSVAGISRKQCIGYSLNDSIRLRSALAKTFSVTPSAVDAIAIGEHGPQCVVISSLIKINGSPVNLDDELRQRLTRQVNEAFYDFESLQTGRTSGWTSAAGISSIIRAVLEDTSQIFPCSAVLAGEYNRTGFSATVPVRIGRKGIKEFIFPALRSAEEFELHRCFDSLEETTFSIG